MFLVIIEVSRFVCLLKLHYLSLRAWYYGLEKSLKLQTASIVYMLVDGWFMVICWLIAYLAIYMPLHVYLPVYIYDTYVNIVRI